MASIARKRRKRNIRRCAEVLQGKRIFLVEDSIVRSTTMQVLLDRIRLGGAREIHVRVACPPIIAPCFYGIDMSRMQELFAPSFCMVGRLDTEIQQQMAAWLGCDSLRYVPVESVSRAHRALSRTTYVKRALPDAIPPNVDSSLYQLALEDAQQVARPPRSGRTKRPAFDWWGPCRSLGRSAHVPLAKPPRSPTRGLPLPGNGRVTRLQSACKTLRGHFPLADGVHPATFPHANLRDDALRSRRLGESRFLAF